MLLVHDVGSYNAQVGAALYGLKAAPWDDINFGFTSALK